MFEKASRKKYRFNSKFGELTVEQLWDLKLQDLNKIALDLDTVIQKEPRKSFLENDNVSLISDTNQDKLNLVVYIIKVKEEELKDQRMLTKKKQEMDLLKEAAVNELNNRKIGKLSDMSDDELKKILS